MAVIAWDCADDAYRERAYNEMAAEIERLQAEVADKSEQIGRLYKVCNEKAVLRAALKPFAELAARLDAAPNLIGILPPEDFRRAAEAFGNEQSQGD